MFLKLILSSFFLIGFFSALHANSYNIYCKIESSLINSETKDSTPPVIGKVNKQYELNLQNTDEFILTVLPVKFPVQQISLEFSHKFSGNPSSLDIQIGNLKTIKKNLKTIDKKDIPDIIQIRTLGFIGKAGCVKQSL